MSIVCDEARNCKMEFETKSNDNIPEDLIPLNMSKETTPTSSIYDFPETFRRKKSRKHIKRKSGPRKSISRKKTTVTRRRRTKASAKRSKPRKVAVRKKKSKSVRRKRS